MTWNRWNWSGWSKGDLGDWWSIDKFGWFGDNLSDLESIKLLIDNQGNRLDLEFSRFWQHTISALCNLGHSDSYLRKTSDIWYIQEL